MQVSAGENGLQTFANDHSLGTFSIKQMYWNPRGKSMYSQSDGEHLVNKKKESWDDYKKYRQAIKTYAKNKLKENQPQVQQVAQNTQQQQVQQQPKSQIINGVPQQQQQQAQQPAAQSAQTPVQQNQQAQPQVQQPVQNAQQPAVQPQQQQKVQETLVAPGGVQNYKGDLEYQSNLEKKNKNRKNTKSPEVRVDKIDVAERGIHEYDKEGYPTEAKKPFKTDMTTTKIKPNSNVVSQDQNSAWKPAKWDD